MRDLKHIVNKKNFSLPSSSKEGERVNSHLHESPRKRRRLRILLPLMAALLALYPVTRFIISSTGFAVPSITTENHVAQKNAGWEAFSAAYRAFDRSRSDGTNLKAVLPDGRTVVYTIDLELQERVRKVFETNHVPYGAFV